MALVENRWRGDLREMRSFWESDRWFRDWDDWPSDWPHPRDLLSRFRSDFERRGSLDWPSDWPTMDSVMPRFSSHLDRLDRNWRSDPFWRDLYPKWAEPIFKEGIDIKAKVINDTDRFAVDIDAYQFRPEEIQVKTVDDTLLIEGRHEDVRDRDNFTKMYFVRKYQLPGEVNPADVTSSIDSAGRLTVEAGKRQRAITGRERVIPVEGPSRRGDSRGSRSHSNSPRDRNDSGGYSPRSQPSPQTRSHSSSYYYHTSKTSGSPNETLQDREHHHQRTNSGDYQREERHERREREYRAESKNEYRSESRQEGAQKYRVDSPTYSQQSGRQNGNGNYSGGLLKTADPPKTESRSESVRSVQILRKTIH